MRLAMAFIEMSSRAINECKRIGGAECGFLSAHEPHAQRS